MPGGKCWSHNRVTLTDRYYLLVNIQNAISPDYRVGYPFRLLLIGSIQPAARPGFDVEPDGGVGPMTCSRTG